MPADPLSRPARAARLAYLALLAWQPAWLYFLPPPLGPRNALLAALAAAPLLLPLRGIFRLRHGAMTWGAYLVVFYFLVGVTESWSNPAQRAAALVQTLLCCACLAAFVQSFRRGRT